MFWFILIILIALYILYKFVSALNKDKEEIKELPLVERYSEFIRTLNNLIFSELGTIQQVDDRTFNLIDQNTNSIVCFFYSTGHLTVTWRKNSLLMGDVSFEKQYNYFREVDYFSQMAVAKGFYNEGEDYFKSKNLPGVYRSNYLYKEEDELENVQLDYTNQDGKFDTVKYSIDIFSDGLINLIDSNIISRELDINDFMTPVYILDTLNHGTESAKETLRNSEEFNLTEDEINEISVEVYKIVYNKYFKH